MVRSFPTGESPRNNPLLSRTFLVAFVLATIAIISYLCGIKKRRRSPPPSTNRTTKLDENPESVALTTNDHTNEATYITAEDKNDDPSPPKSTVPKENKELRPPPRMAHLRAASYHVGASSNTSQGAKLTSSMSMRVPGGLKGLKKGLKKDDNKNDYKREKDKLKHEDSVWKKTIILGEKCRVPNEDEDTIVYDENGRPITTFHRKQPTGLTISRQNSNINQDMIPNEQENR